MIRYGLFADEFARFGVLARKLISRDTAILKVSTRIGEDAWGELFTTNTGLPKSFCVMVKCAEEGVKPYTPVAVDKESLDLLVKMYPNGSVSQPLFHKQSGEHIWMQGPRIKYDFNRLRKGRLIGIAGGTGIAPIYQIFKAPEVKDYQKILIFANKTAEDILLKGELESIPNLHIQHVLQDRDGFIQASHLPPPQPEDQVFYCGPKLFNEHVALLLANFDQKNVFKF